MRRKHKHLEPMRDVQGMSVTTAQQRLTTKTATLRAFPRVPQVLFVSAHIVGFRVVLRVDIVLRVVNGVLVPVIVHSICIPKFLQISHREHGSFEVLSLHFSSVTVDRRQL